MDIIKDRIELGICPICKKVTIETKVIKDIKYGEVKICKIHHVDGEKE